MKTQQPEIAIYVIDDDEVQRFVLQEIFIAKKIYNYTFFSKPADLLEALHRGVQIAIIDYDLRDPQMDGYELMKAVKLQNRYCKCIISSGMETYDTAVQFMNGGAFRFIGKTVKDYAGQLLHFINEAKDELNESFNFFNPVTEELNNLKGKLEELRNL